jgi:23S rRNA (adenine2503-C2)-methyltransferase
MIALCQEAGFSRGRAQNLFRLLHDKPETPLLELRGVNADLRHYAAKHWTLHGLTPQGHQRQVEDGNTRKLLFATWDELPVEAVLMPRKAGGLTVCISCQVGCRVGCTFCRTGEMGLQRNLTASEIVDQVRWSRHLAQAPIRNMVFMGMGEPMENLEAVLTAIEVLRASEVYAISRRRITISTSGHIPGIRTLSQRAPKINLALSLNAPYDTLRSQIMPINRRYPLAPLLQELRTYPLGRTDWIMIEYVLFAGLNDEPHHAHALASLLQGMQVKVNLIRYNPVPGLPFQRPSPKRVEAFKKALGEVGHGVVQRYSWGSGIAAACGQLGAEILHQTKKPGEAPVPPAPVLPWTPVPV